MFGLMLTSTHKKYVEDLNSIIGKRDRTILTQSGRIDKRNEEYRLLERELFHLKSNVASKTHSLTKLINKLKS